MLCPNLLINSLRALLLLRVARFSSFEYILTLLEENDLKRMIFQKLNYLFFIQLIQISQS